MSWEGNKTSALMNKCFLLVMFDKFWRTGENCCVRISIFNSRILFRMGSRSRSSLKRAYPVPQNARHLRAEMCPVRSYPQDRPQSYGVKVPNSAEGRCLKATDACLPSHRQIGPRYGAYVALLLILNLTSCTLVRLPDANQERRLRGTVDLVTEVKEFGNSLGIEPTEALRQTSQGNPALSMLWLWLQRMGTLALRAPVDIRMAIGFHADREKIPLERVYRVEGYSVYYRQGNEFADARSVATAGFADEGIVRRVKVIFH